MKKTLMIIGGFVLGFVCIGVVIFIIVSATSKKLVCTSSRGNITIMYNDETITGYTSSGISYDMEQQKTVVEKIGIEKYLEDFSSFFSNGSDGSCKK